MRTLREGVPEPVGPAVLSKSGAALSTVHAAARASPPEGCQQGCHAAFLGVLSLHLALGPGHSGRVQAFCSASCTCTGMPAGAWTPWLAGCAMLLACWRRVCWTACVRGATAAGATRSWAGAWHGMGLRGAGLHRLGWISVHGVRSEAKRTSSLLPEILREPKAPHEPRFLCKHSACRDITAGKVGLEELEQVALSQPEPFESLPSGQQELYEIWLSRYVR